MVQINSHGGSCCGARHIHGFGTRDNPNNIIEMHNHAASAPDRLTEIILNKDQCRASPRLLAAMAERGYVLTTGFKNGNHDSDVFVFHRADRRLRLDNVNRDFGFEWNGQLASPTLHGNLTPLRPTQVQPAGALQERYRQTGANVYDQFLNFYPNDMLISYVGPSRVRQGQIFGLRNGYANWQNSRGYNDNGYRTLRVRNVTTGEDVELSIESFQIHRFTAAAPQQEAPPPPLGNQRYEGGLAAPAGHIEVERIVYTTYHNVYRDGRIGAGYPTSQEAHNAAPRALNRLTRHIYNTGRVEDLIADVQNEGA